MTLPATVAGGVAVEYQDPDGVWQPFGPAQDLGTLKRTRRFALGPRRSVTARLWRINKLAPFDWDTAHFVLDAVRAWVETDELSAVRIVPFSFDDDEQTYFHVRTDRNVEVYRNDQRIASIPMPHTAGQVRTVRKAQVLDTQINYHPQVAPWRVTRQGAHSQWDSRAVIFDSLPTFDFVGDRAGGVNEIQELKFTSYAGGDTFNITLEGETTDSIAYSASMAAAIQAALEDLPNVGTGGVTVTLTGTDTYRVEFIGDNRADDVGEMVPKTLVSTSGLARCATITQGKAGGEPVISDARGWPSCGTFYQGRHYMGGLKSRPQTILGSRLFDWFQFASKGQATAISEDLDTSETTPIEEMYAGQHLQVFTTSAEFFFTTEPIVPPSPVKRTSRRGLAKGVPVAEISGATLLITAGGVSAAEFVYDDSVQRYQAPFLSKFATHLLAGFKTAPRQVVDLGFRRAQTSVEADRAMMVRNDGQIAVMYALREDGVTSFVPWQTDGLVVAAAADLAGTEYLAVVRDRPAGQEVLLEKLDDAAVLDSQVRVTGATAGPVTGLGHLEGREVAIYIDGGDAGDATVIDGQVALPQAALREVCVGLPFTVRAVTLPLVLQLDPRGGAEMEARAGQIAVEFGPTASLKGGLKGGKMYDFKLPAGGDGFGPGEKPFVGWKTLDAVPGFRNDPQVQFEKIRPGPLEIRQIVVTVET